MLKLSQIKEKLLHRGFSSLFGSEEKENIHPADVAHILNNLPQKSAIETYLSLPEQSQLSLFNYLDIYLEQCIIEAAPKEKAAYILNNINSTDRYKFYSSLKGIKRSVLLELLDKKLRKATEDMLGYPKQSVARLVNTSFCTINEEMPIAKAMDYLRENHKDTDAADVIYVTDSKGKLVDDLPIRRLVLNDPNKKVADVMDHSFVKLNINDTTDEAIAKFKHYDRTVLPVTNSANILMGILTIDDLLDVAERRNTREMQRFGGVESLEYPYVKTPIFSLIKKRAGWLIILFLSEMLTATAMGHFQEYIAKAVVLALFVPLVMSSGGNSGSQAATLIIRAMAVKELTPKDWFYVMRRELLSGLILGLVLGTIGFLRIAAWQRLGWFDYGKDWELMGITIFFSLIGIVLWGTLSGSMIPMLLKSLKLDPAASSAPFVATLVDVTGLIIYFSIAAVVLRDTLLK